MKSSLKNMVLVLFSISLIASLCLGVVNMVTEKPIAEAKAAVDKAAVKSVLPEFEAVETTQIDSLGVVVNKATKGSEVVGYAIKCESKNGFGGVVKLMVGFDTKGIILNVEVLEQKETPGLGTNMAIKGDSVKNPLLKLNGKEAPKTKLSVKKDGGEVDALTAATISSRAYLDAVNRACVAMMNVTGQEAPDGVSGATTVAENAEQTEPAAQEGGQNE